MDGIKDFFLHKLVLRLIYMAAAYTTAHLVALAASPQVLTLLNGAGVSLAITDPMAFKTHITAGILTLGEVAFYWIHKKLILPHVTPVSPAPAVTVK